MSPVPPTVMPPVAAWFAVQRSLELPDRRYLWLLQSSERHQRDAITAIALGLQEIEAAVDCSSPGRGAFGFFAQAFRLFCKTLI